MHCVPNAAAPSVMMRGLRTACELTETLGAGEQHRPHVGHRSDAATHRERNEDLFRNAAYHVEHDAAARRMR